ncbi:hypothetical protein NA57DRAFT_76695 [Rhizodiscina lignyota]|uniref:Uncharacterized protein n=1 Tax=Rhizodiscina lignyota TaxID=1504668 RepID=A0A9P4IF07_9PEZI|nr:hypothetical protein NA57DRAFT_76695 [Rhizodiscina lignyota]
MTPKKSSTTRTRGSKEPRHIRDTLRDLDLAFKDNESGMGRPTICDTNAVEWEAQISELSKEVWNEADSRSDYIEKQLNDTLDHFGPQLWNNSTSGKLIYPRDRDRLLLLHHACLQRKMLDKKRNSYSQRRRNDTNSGLEKNVLNWLVLTDVSIGEPSGESSKKSRTSPETESSSHLSPSSGPSPNSSDVSNWSDTEFFEAQRLRLSVSSSKEHDDVADPDNEISQGSESDGNDRSNYTQKATSGDFSMTDDATTINPSDLIGTETTTEPSNSILSSTHSTVHATSGAEVSGSETSKDAEAARHNLEDGDEDQCIVDRQLDETILEIDIPGRLICLEMVLKDYEPKISVFDGILKRLPSAFLRKVETFDFLTVALPFDLAPEPSLHMCWKNAESFDRFLNTIRRGLEERIDFDERSKFRIRMKLSYTAMNA